jgi:hypothetical protein
MQTSSSSIPKQQLNKNATRRAYRVVIFIWGLIAVVFFFSLLGPSIACATIDGSRFRADIKVEDHWGNVRNPEISFKDGWYSWVTGGDQVLAGPYKCAAGRVVSQEGWTFQLSAGGTVLTASGIEYKRVFR